MSELLAELQLLAPLNNLCPTGTTGMLDRMAMLVPTGATSTSCGMAGVPVFQYLEPLPGLLLLAPLGNLCPMGITSMPIGAAGLAPSGIVSMPLGKTGVLEMGRPVARYAARARGGPAGTVRQYASDRHYKPTVHSGMNAGYDTASVVDGARGVNRQTGPALGHT